jgi:hypothetical protein
LTFTCDDGDDGDDSDDDDDAGDNGDHGGGASDTTGNVVGDCVTVEGGRVTMLCGRMGNRW